MPQNFLACDREQELMLPPSLREWLPDDHLAWFVLAAVEEIDLTGFYAAYRRDGHGRAALVAGDRAGVRRRCRGPRGGGESAARSLHDRAVSPAPRGCPGRFV